MSTVPRIIKAHNKQTLEKDKKTTNKTCNCRNKDLCPLQGKCLTTNVIYNAEVTSLDKTMIYIGLTDRNPPSSSGTTTISNLSDTKGTKTARSYLNPSGI